MADSDVDLVKRFVRSVSEWIAADPGRERYNIAPGADVPVFGPGGIEVLRWGLKASGRPFNIRADSFSKPWAKALLRNRVVFPASGFYEWQAPADAKGPKQPWEGPGASMITTDGNETMEGIHHRMPVLLDDEGLAAWLGPDTPVGRVLGLLRPAGADALERYRVRRTVSNSRNEGADLIEPVE